jgi:uncharacterized protein YoxC
MPFVSQQVLDEIARNNAHNVQQIAGMQNRFEALSKSVNGSTADVLKEIANLHSILSAVADAAVEYRMQELRAKVRSVATPTRKKAAKKR